VTALEASALLDRAEEATGLSDLGEASWREGLERLVDALQGEARLHELGVDIVAADIATYLTNRLRVTDWHARHPEIAQRPIAAPIVIVGQGRTGTTILHDLLAQDAANRVPLTWEVDHPHPPPETATYETDARVDAVQAELDSTELLIPGFLSMHPIGARLAQECVRITGGDFRSMIFPTQYHVPSYARWLLHDADMAPAYRYHRRFLQLLQWRHAGERWVLKSPGHIWCLDALLAEYPDALLVQTHRDPLAIVASLSSLVAVLRRMYTDETSIAQAAADFVDDLVLGLDRSVDARDDGTVPADRVVDVQFRAFMDDPFVTIREVYDRLGLQLDAATEHRMRAFLADHSREKHGTHEYTFAATGLDAGELRARTRRYTERFDVPAEPVL
jgi:hypothetical protein